MSNWKIPLYKVLSDAEDYRLVKNVIKRGMHWTLGPEISQFEKSLAEYVGTKYCVTFNSGTSALHASLIASIAQRTEVILPSFTFIATANSSLMANALPKFVDIEEDSYGINPKLLDSAITKKTKIIMPVHYAGLSCKISEIKKIAHDRNLLLLEDAAESLGATYNKKKVGSFGDLAVFSFAGNKILTTGEGGAVVTSSKKIYDKLLLIRSHGRHEKFNYFSSITNPEYVELGYNWRMSSITAALGISQLNKIEKLIKMRRNNAQFLSKKLKRHNQIILPLEPTNYRHVFQFYSIRMPNSYVRNNLMKFLASKGIMTKVFFEPIHLTKFYKKLGIGNRKKLNVTEIISNQILSLPMYPTLIRDELNFICDSISEFLETKKSS